MEYASNHTQLSIWSEIAEPTFEWESWREVALRGLEGLAAVVMAIIIVTFIAV